MAFVIKRPDQMLATAGLQLDIVRVRSMVHRIVGRAGDRRRRLNNVAEGHQRR